MASGKGASDLGSRSTDIEEVKTIAQSDAARSPDGNNGRRFNSQREYMYAVLDDLKKAGYFQKKTGPRTPVELSSSSWELFKPGEGPLYDKDNLPKGIII